MIAAPLALATKVSIVNDFLGGALGGIGGKLGFTDTPEDKRRKQNAASLLQRSLDGDMSALRQLCYEAFEKRSNLPGDVRIPPNDKKFSPEAVQKLAKTALKKYVEAVGGMPAALQQYASKVGANVLSANAIIEAINTYMPGPSAPTPTIFPITTAVPVPTLPASQGNNMNLVIGAVAAGGLLLFLSRGSRS